MLISLSVVCKRGTEVVLVHCSVPLRELVVRVELLDAHRRIVGLARRCVFTLLRTLPIIFTAFRNLWAIIRPCNTPLPLRGIPGCARGLV